MDMPKKCMGMTLQELKRWWLQTGKIIIIYCYGLGGMIIAMSTIVHFTST